MTSLDFASMSIDELKAHIENLNISLTNAERQLRDYTHANHIFCGSINERGIFPEEYAGEQRKLCLQRQREEILTELKKARECLISRQMLDK